MKKLKTDKKICIDCGNCELACANTFFREKEREKSAIIVEIGEGKGIRVCNQCGLCIDICPAEAIYRDKNGVVRIKKDLCVGCFACVGFCPEGAMFRHCEYLEPFKCVACGVCAKECPTGAISIEEI